MACKQVMLRNDGGYIGKLSDYPINYRRSSNGVSVNQTNVRSFDLKILKNNGLKWGSSEPGNQKRSQNRKNPQISSIFTRGTGVKWKIRRQGPGSSLGHKS